MRLKAACQLEATESGGRSRPVDLKKGQVSLDKFSASGNYFDGTLLFSGTIVVDGVVKVVPSDAGNIFFFPNRPRTLQKRFRTPVLWRPTEVDERAGRTVHDPEGKQLLARNSQNPHAWH